MLAKLKKSKIYHTLENLLHIHRPIPSGQNGLISMLNDRYTLLENIGHGAYGVVFSAIKNSDENPVAIKVIKKKRVSTWTKDGSKKMPLEIHMMNKCLGFPGVAQIVEWHVLLDYYIIIMSRPENFIDLKTLVEKAKILNEDVARFLFKQVVKTTKFLLDHDVVHKDIKMENVIIDTKTGQTLLVDFGAATPKNVDCKQIQGTSGYIPPEWYLYALYSDEPSTIWSLGVLLYTMLNGKLPFASEFDACIVRNVDFLSDHDYSQSAKKLIENCLCFDFTERYTFDEIENDEWFSKPTLDWDKLISDMDFL